MKLRSQLVAGLVFVMLLAVVAEAQEQPTRRPGMRPGRERPFGRRTHTQPANPAPEAGATPIRPGEPAYGDPNTPPGHAPAPTPQPGRTPPTPVAPPSAAPPSAGAPATPAEPAERLRTPGHVPPTPPPPGDVAPPAPAAGMPPPPGAPETLAPVTAPATPAPRVVLELIQSQKELGQIVIELDAAKAPATVANFLRYVDEGFYDNTTFHRIVPEGLVQGGAYVGRTQKKDTGLHEPIAGEAGNGLKNERGTIAMAHTWKKPNSATTQFFINLKDNPQFDPEYRHGDGGYTVFGRVVEGLEVVERVAKSATRPSSLLPTEKSEPITPPVIRRAYRFGTPPPPLAGSPGLPAGVPPPQPVSEADVPHLEEIPIGEVTEVGAPVTQPTEPPPMEPPPGGEPAPVTPPPPGNEPVPQPGNEPPPPPPGNEPAPAPPPGNEPPPAPPAPPPTQPAHPE